MWFILVTLGTVPFSDNSQILDRILNHRSASDKKRCAKPSQNFERLREHDLATTNFSKCGVTLIHVRQLMLQTNRVLYTKVSLSYQKTCVI